MRMLADAHKVALNHKRRDATPANTEKRKNTVGQYKLRDVTSSNGVNDKLYRRGKEHQHNVSTEAGNN